MKYAYVGCRTTKVRNARGQGLMVYEIGSDGGWTEKQCLFTEENPSYQCLDREKKYLYSVHGDLTLASSYRILEDGTLEHLNTIDIGGKNPVDITADAENKNVIIATLQGGTLYTVQSPCIQSLYRQHGSLPYRSMYRLSENHRILSLPGQDPSFLLLRTKRQMLHGK